MHRLGMDEAWEPHCDPGLLPRAKVVGDITLLLASDLQVRSSRLNNRRSRLAGVAVCHKVLMALSISNGILETVYESEGPLERVV